MPEGDTLHKLARALAPLLVERAVDGLWLRDRGWLAPLAGRRLSEVTALGKHLLVGLAPDGPRPDPRPRPDWVLHAHLGMHGRIHRYRSEEPWRRPSHQAVARLEAGGERIVFFRAAVAEVLRAVDLALHPALSRLGPDLLGPTLDLGRVVARARAREPRSAADLLLDQTVACGIGNVYKSEVLFLEGVHPGTRVDRLDADTLARLYATARRLLRANLGGWRRTTRRAVTPSTPLRRGEERLWVYGRADRPCLRCATPVRSARLGDAARATWWCPGCQRPAARYAAAPVARRV